MVTGGVRSDVEADWEPLEMLGEEERQGKGGLELLEEGKELEKWALEGGMEPTRLDPGLRLQA